MPFLLETRLFNFNSVSLWERKTFKIHTRIFKPQLLVGGLFRVLNSKTCNPKKSLLSLWEFKQFRVT